MSVSPLHDMAAVPDLGHLLRWRAATQPDRRAYAFQQQGAEEEDRVSYRQLDRQARIIGARLQACGAADQCVLLLFPPGIQYIAALLGCMYAGSIAVPSYPPRSHWSASRFTSILSDASIAVILTTEHELASLQRRPEQVLSTGSARWLTIDGPETMATAPEDWHEPSLTREAIAVLQYTSGSTSSPKGVALTHGNLLHNSLLIAQAFGHSFASRGCSWLPPYHDMGLVGGILQPLYCGIPVVLLSPFAFLQRPIRWLEAISRSRATTSGGPNFAYDLCVQRIPPAQRAGLDLSCWEVAFCGAEPIRPETLDRFAEAFGPCGFRREAFFPCYGLAEATLIASGGRKGAPPVTLAVERAALEQHRAVVAARDAGPGVQAIVGCGQSLGGQQIVIVDPQTCRRLRDDEVGEVWMAGPSVARGYYRQPAETQATFQAATDDTGEGPFLRTGDLGFLHEVAGGRELFITGRLKDVMNVRGRNIYPQDIERTAELSHAALELNGSVAFGVEPEGNGTEALVLALEIVRGWQPLDVDGVVNAIREAIAQQHELDTFAVVLLKPGALPRTSSGKVQRQACRERFLGKQLDAVAEWQAALPAEERTPTDFAYEQGEPFLFGQVDEIEAWLVSKTAALLRIAPEALDRSHHLTRYGLDSLRAAELLACIETATGLQLSPAALLEDGSVASLARQIAAGRARPGAEQPIPPIPARRAEGAAVRFPLSSAQQRLWFLHLLAPDSVAYHLAAVVRLRGALNQAALARSVRELVLRHEALRTVFVAGDAGPTQLAMPANALPMAAEDLTGLPAPDREHEALRLAREDARRPFDLNRGPLLRVRLLRLDSKDHLLLLVMHHIISDGVSLHIVCRELSALYEAYSQGRPSPLPALAHQYGDYAAWQRALSRDGALPGQLDYWTAKLAGLRDLQMPTDRPRPATQSYQGARHTLPIPPQVARQFHTFCRQEGITLFMLLLAAFQLLLHRYSGQDDIAVGTPAAARGRGELGQLIGCFVQNLVLRTGLSGDPTVRDLLRRVRDVCLDAYAHQDVPFEQIVGALRPERDAGRHPLFQVMLTLQDDPQVSLRLPGIDARALEIDLGGSAFDLTVFFWQNGETLRATFEYATDLYDAPTIERLAGHLLGILRATVAQPQQRISEVQFLQESEREQLLRVWNATAVDFPAGRCLHELFEAQVERTPEAVALAFGQSRLTYRELNERSNQLARCLRSLGIGPEVPVGLLLQRSPELLVGLLGILKAGGAYVPLDPTYPEERLSFMLADAEAPLVLTASHLAGALSRRSSASRLLCLDSDWQRACSRRKKDNLPPTAAEDHLAYVIYTSGSTGAPKGVQITHKNAVASTHAREHYYRDPVERFLLLSSPAFDSSVAGIFWSLCQGGMLVIPPDHAPGDAWQLVELIHRERVTHLLCIPSLYAAILEVAQPQQLTSLKHCIVAGEACPLEVLAQHRARCASAQLFNEYGPTEGTVWSSVFRCHPREEPGSSVPIGRPIANVQLFVLDGRLQLAPIGVPGELYIGGAGVARGYLKRPDLTEERFIPHPFGQEPGERVYRTGDRVRYLPSGDLVFLGRLDEQVKMRGYRIELSEIEAALRRHPGIGQAAVTVWESSAAGAQHLVAYYTSREQPQPGAHDLSRHLRACLPDYMVPVYYVPLVDMPLSPHGKVDRKALPAPQLVSVQESATRNGPIEPPRTALERIVADIWSDVLGVEQFGVHDNFFDLGGHSMLAARLLVRVYGTLNVGIPLRSLFEAPTVAGMAHILEKALQGSFTSPTTPAASAAQDFSEDALLDPDISPAADDRAFTRLAPQRIFLTGATGFLGSFLLHELLAHTRAEVYCLVQAESEGSGKARLQRSLEARLLWDHEQQSRIVPVPGDLALPLFGLSTRQFKELAATVEAVYHCGAQVNFLSPYHRLRAANVFGTQEALRLACSARHKPLHYVSTTSVFAPGDRESEQVIGELEALGDRADGLPNGYAQSKWVAERLVWQAISRGLAACIYRPGLVTGSSATGVSNLDDFMNRMVKGCLQLGMAPDIDVRVDMTPVDYVARAMVYLSRQSAAPGKAYHLVGPRPVSLLDLIEWASAHGYPLRVVPYAFWRERLFDAARRGTDNALYPLLPLFLPQAKGDMFQWLQAQTRSIGFDDTYARQGLASSAISCPPADSALLAAYFAYFRSSGFMAELESPQASRGGRV